MLSSERRSGAPRRAVGPSPGTAALHEAALAYLARCAASKTMVARALDRKMLSWARSARRAGLSEESIAADVARARDCIPPILARLVEVHVVDDAAFAEGRARALSRAGRSRRAIAAHLLARGVDADTARDHLPTDPAAELTAALVFARRRRMGPFESTSRTGTGARTRERALGALARAGFSREVADRALRASRDEAEELLARDRRP